MARSRSRWLVVLGAALSVPALFACNSILGLDDYKNVDCNGGRCADGDLPDVFRPDVDPRDVVTTDVVDESQGATPTVWARWPMPNYVPDGGTLPNPPSYDAGSGVVTDNVTGLVWQNRSDRTAFSYEDAKAHCAGLAGSWRLPKRIELVTLLDFASPKAARVGAPFDVVSGIYWTSSEVRPFNAAAPSYWVVDFGSGQVTTKPTGDGNEYFTLCVKAK